MTRLREDGADCAGNLWPGGGNDATPKGTLTPHPEVIRQDRQLHQQF